MASDASKWRTNKEFADPSINFYLAPGDVLVQCPYYPHKVLQCKLTTHLSKCSSQYKKDRIKDPKLPKFVICTGNWTHHVKEADYENHVNNDCEESRARKELEAKEEAEALERGYGSGFQPRYNHPTKVDNIAVNEVSLGNSLASSVVGVSSSVSVATNSKESFESSFFSSAQSQVSTGSSIVSTIERVGIRKGPAVPVKTENANTPSPPGPGQTRARATKAKEDWDAELRAPNRQVGMPTMDIRNQGPTQHLYYIPAGMSKSERVAYRQKMVELARLKPTVGRTTATTADDERNSANGNKQPPEPKYKYEDYDFSDVQPRPAHVKTSRPRAADKFGDEEGWGGNTFDATEVYYDHDVDAEPPGRNQRARTSGQQE